MNSLIEANRPEIERIRERHHVSRFELFELRALNRGRGSLEIAVTKLQPCGGGKTKTLNRITLDPALMGGRPCIRGLRVTVGTIVGLMGAGRAHEEILKLYPYLEPADIDEALIYAAWRAEEMEVPLHTV